MADEKQTHTRRRGIARSSLTKLETAVKDLQAKPERDKTVRSTAQRYQERMKDLSAEFKMHHYALIDLVEERDLGREQDVFDEHEEKLSNLTVALEQIISDCKSGSKTVTVSQLEKRLHHVERNLDSVVATVDVEAVRSKIDVCLLQQYEDQLTDIKTELSSIAREIITLDFDATALSDLEAKLSKRRFDTSLKLRCALQKDKLTDSSKPDEKAGAKLPRLEVPMFDGNLLNWKTFWEQYTTSVLKRD